MSEEQKENIQAGNPLGEDSVASLMVKFAVPSIIAMIVSALYNIVDSIFIFTYNLVNLYLVNSYLFNTLP